MQPGEPQDDRYVLARLHEALCHDERTSEQGISVSVTGDTVVLSGTVPTAERQAAVSAVAAEILGDRELRNEVVVADMSEPTTIEEVS